MNELNTIYLNIRTEGKTNEMTSSDRITGVVLNWNPADSLCLLRRLAFFFCHQKKTQQNVVNMTEMQTHKPKIRIAISQLDSWCKLVALREHTVFLFSESGRRIFDKKSNIRCFCSHSLLLDGFTRISIGFCTMSDVLLAYPRECRPTSARQNKRSAQPLPGVYHKCVSQNQIVWRQFLYYSAQTYKIHICTVWHGLRRVWLFFTTHHNATNG